MEEQQNNNLSAEILSGNTESLTGLVGNANALKEPGMDYNPCQLVLQFCLCSCQIPYKSQDTVLLPCVHPCRNWLPFLSVNYKSNPFRLKFVFSFVFFSDNVGAQSV